MKSNNFNPDKNIANALKRYNLVIFIVILSSGLIVAVIMLTNIFTQPNNTNLNDIDANTSDQVTIDELDRLESSSTNINYRSLPATRINPFFE